MIIASTVELRLFTTFTFAPGTSLGDNLIDLFAYGDGQFCGPPATSCTRAAVPVSTLVSTMAGYALAKFSFPARRSGTPRPRGRALPGITLAVPQYLLLANRPGGSYWSVLLPT